MVKHLKIGNMTKKDKELLLKDLCARLPYGVKVAYTEKICDLDTICCDSSILLKGEDGFFIPDIANNLFIEIDKVKLYLRPMSSMTKKEEKEYSKFAHFGNTLGDWIKSIDWLNAHHFDYRGLIKKGLALPAPDGMYDF